jgi:ribose/xylose/arabinose/galactoside ABC-type transport system permease subunit
MAASTASVRQQGAGAGVALEWVRERGVYVVFAALVLFNVLYTPNYATKGTLTGTLIQVTPVLVVSLGLTLVIATGGIDISIGAVMAIASAIVPLYLGWGWPVAVLLALVVCTLAGTVNGTLVAYVGVQPIVATLALFVGGRGFAQVLVDGRLQTIDNPSFLAIARNTVFGIPQQVLVAGVIALIVYLVVKRTTFGRYVVAIGGNREAAYLSGQPVRKVLFGVYAISGLLAGVAGVFATARLGAGDPSTTGLLIELDAIAAVVVGGTALAGGRISVPGTIVGALLMQVINATFVSNDLPPTWAQILKAVIIVAALYIQQRREGDA